METLAESRHRAVEFDVLNTRFILPLADLVNHQVASLSLSIRRDFFYFAQGGAGRRPIAELRLLLDREDFTDVYCRSLAAALSSADRAVEYHAGLDHFAGLLEKLGDGPYGRPVADEIRAAALLKAEPLPSLVSQLGSIGGRFGVFGNLHPINFVFRHIASRPIPLWTSASGRQLPHTLEIIQLAADGGEPKPGTGRLEVGVHIVYVDTIVDQILGKIAELERELGPDGDLQKALKGLQSETGRLSTQATEIATKVADLANRSTLLKAAIEHLANRP